MSETPAVVQPKPEEGGVGADQARGIIAGTEAVPEYRWESAGGRPIGD